MSADEASSILYLLDARFPYDCVVAEDCGAPFAAPYGWTVVTAVPAGFRGAVVVDTRFTPEGLPQVKALIESGQATIFLRLTDPGWSANRDHWWYSFVRTMVVHANVHLMATYAPSEVISLIWSETLGQQFLYAPYLYDRTKERALDHASRKTRILLSGQMNKHIYPVRTAAAKITKYWPPLHAMVDHLPHPGYPDVGQRRQHDVIGAKFLDRMAQYRFAFVCGSRDRLELLKYREIAYAGAVPVGDLPDTLLDAPDSAWIAWRRNLPALRRSLLTCASEAAAQSWRDFMRAKRDANILAPQVNAVILARTR